MPFCLFRKDQIKGFFGWDKWKSKRLDMIYTFLMVLQLVTLYIWLCSAAPTCPVSKSKSTRKASIVQTETGIQYTWGTIWYASYFAVILVAAGKERQVLFSQETYTGYIVQVGNKLNLIEFPLEKQKLHWKVAEFCHMLKVKKKTVVGALQKAKAVVYPKPNHIPWWNMIQRVIEKLMGRGYV